MRNISSFLSLLHNVKSAGTNQWTADCPCSTHKSPVKHLSIGLKDDTILLTCFGSDTAEDIVKALGITMSDLWTEPKRGEASLKTITAEYSYKDEAGKELFQVVRYTPKSFAQRHRNSNNEWVWNTTGVRKVLYHLPEILIETGKIYFVEGEKDADKLWQWGQVATTSPGGANAWKPEYAEPLTGKSVVLIPDNDLAGMAYARVVARSLKDKAHSVACVLLEDAKDISDWLEKGNDIAGLPGMEQPISALLQTEKPRYERDGDKVFWVSGDWTYQAERIREERTGIHARITISQEEQPIAWTLANFERSEERVRLANQVKKNDENIRLSLDQFCAGLWEFWVGSDAPEMIAGEDTAPPSFYLYPYILKDGGSILFSPPGRGKSISALLWAQSINTGSSSFWKVQKQPVLYINLERSSQSLKRRLASVNRVLGLRADTPLLILNRRGQPLSALAPSIANAVQIYGIKVIVLDSISRAGYGDLTENRPVNQIIDTLSNLCPSWLALAHAPRASEEHMYGSVMFEAGADIVIQLSSEPEATKLGIRYEITKSNDLPQIPAQTWSYEFEDWSLKSVEKAGEFEFADLEMKKKPKILPATIDFILNQDSGDATATQIEKELGYTRANVTRLFIKSGKFVKTRKVGNAQFYGVAE